MQLEGQSLRLGGRMAEARALTLTLPPGVPRAYRAALGALRTLLGTRPGSAGAKGGFLSLDLASMRDSEERRRQQRLAKTRVTAAASR